MSETKQIRLKSSLLARVRLAAAYESAETGVSVNERGIIEREVEKYLSKWRVDPNVFVNMGDEKDGK